MFIYVITQGMEEEKLNIQRLWKEMRREIIQAELVTNPATTQETLGKLFDISESEFHSMDQRDNMWVDGLFTTITQENLSHPEEWLTW